MSNTELSYAKGEPVKPLIEETIGADLENTVARFGDRTALVDVPSGRRWTYTEFGADVNRLAKGLLAVGLEKGDRMGIWSPNYPEWTLLQYATAKVGVVLVNVNPAYRTHEFDYVVEQSGMRMIAAAVEYKSSKYRQMVEQTLAKRPSLERAFYIGDASWDELLAGGESISDEQLHERSDSLDPHDPINIQYTSGTTGFPKGATLSHRNILNNGFFVGEGLTYTEKDIVCIPMPFYHCFGMVMGNLACTSHGACMVIPGPTFDPVAALTAVEQEHCTSLYGVPTMFIAELGLPNFADFDLSSLRTGIMSGSPCPVEAMKKVIDRMGMAEVVICYGMTETSPVSTITRADDDMRRRTETVGRAMPHVEIQILDPVTGERVPRGTTGEFCTRGYSVMKGYWNAPERTAEAIDADGWMHTGDLAVMDEDGYCAIVGRMKDMVIRGGENIYPREIEEFLYTHPAIADVSVVGVPDEKYGEELMAWIITVPGHEALTAEDLDEFSAGRLAHYKVPRYVHCVDSFPMTVTGKIRKVDMRDEAVRLLGLQR
ncbi:AMP-binding protein [Mobilicoccus pelagius]|uniref:Putative fatty-acid--CoA ligase n=1 Tax=Mobilicoccus pelagius NBRC 104925 TaxID=1089455 RepID=H5UTA9_9MICO|nr:AMP-binding protein [Mobilicoccus pelagius]GAB48967.1 putative fatty-acid--CoA ligase [Mobilicoccus pelagius NBRC 104925]